MRIGVLAPAEIALRRFMPALSETPGVEFAGVAVHSNRERAEAFVAQYGGAVYPSFDALLGDDGIEAVYVPLPPGLHAEWGRRVLRAGKHLLMEKPFTVAADETTSLIELARQSGLAVHENYMFAYHAQLDAVRRIVSSGAIGDVRLIRIDFGFPRRAQNDFRYDASLGGGALLDAGGYTLRYAAMLLGPSAELRAAASNHVAGIDVDVYGSAMLVNERGDAAQIAFGMDNAYRCDLDVWGSTGSLRTGRILTAPSGFTPSATVTTAEGAQTVDLPADDSFRRSIEHFLACIDDAGAREARYREIQAQGELVDAFRMAAGTEAARTV